MTISTPEFQSTTLADAAAAARHLADAAAAARHLAAQGELDAAAEHLAEAVTAAAPVGADRLAWAELAEEIGALDLALTQLRAALTEAPDHAASAEALAQLEADLGVEPAEPSPAPAPEIASDDLPAPSPADRVRFIHLFGGRQGVHARQWIDRRGATVVKTGYSPVHAPLTPAVLDTHLQGRVTVGAYPIRLDQTVTWFCLDLDLTKRALSIGDAQHAAAVRAEIHQIGLDLHAALLDLGLATLLEDSGYKGRHLWGLLERPLPADLVHGAGRLLLKALKPASPWVHLEFFPKQPRVAADGLGNLVKLPLGRHQRTGRRALLLDATGAPVANPWTHLKAAPRITRDALLNAMAACRDRPAAPRAEAPQPTPEVVETALVPSDDQLSALRAMLDGCPVLARLIEQGFNERRLSHDEQVVLVHSVGHLPAGVALLQRLFAHCPEVPRHAIPKRQQRGHPISCGRVRQRLPMLTIGQPCHCVLDRGPGTYPNPTIHGQLP